MQRRNVTGFEVAELANVSQPTVSRALRNLPSISPETRLRVQWAAEQLGYVLEKPRARPAQRTRRIAVLSAELTNPYYPELIEPLRAELEAIDYRTVLVTDASAGAATVDLLSDGSYDGVILTTTLRSSSLPRDLSERGVPHVLVNRVLDHPESQACSIDNQAGMEQVADLLVRLGHRTVGSLQGPVDTSTGRERARAIRDALRARGVRLRRSLDRRVAFDHDAALTSALQLLDAADRPTAIVCGNDVIALGVMSAARRAGVAVPEELTVVGFDDLPMAGWPLIGLTTVSCDLTALARRSVELLLASLDRDALDPPQHVRLRPRLVLRGTHAHAAS